MSPHSTADEKSERLFTSSPNSHIPHINLQSLLQDDHSVLAPTASGRQSIPPGYAEAMRDASLTKEESHSDDSQDEALPRYADIPKEEASASSPLGFLTSTAPGFAPSVSFQIEAKGHPLVALPFAPKPAHIPVYRVGSLGEASHDLAYISLRDLKGRTSSCLLVDGETRKIAATTSHRFGPGKPAKFRYIKDGPVLPTGDDEGVARLLKEEESARLGDGKGKAKEKKKQSPETEAFDGKTHLPHTPASEVIEITSNGFSTRSHTLLTPLGTFRWRYATKTERLEANADELLVFERIYTITTPSASKFRKEKTEERRKRVAMFVRNDEVRTEGTGARDAGNGGRLYCDFGEWEERHVGRGMVLEEKRGGAGGMSEERREVEVLTVASCLSMLKKEVDRRRLHQTMVIVGTGAAL